MAVIHHRVRYATTPIKAAASWQQLCPSDQVHLLGRLLWSSSHRAHRHGWPRADGHHWHRDLQPHSSHDRLHQQEALLGRRQPHPVCHHGWRPETQRWDEGVARLKNSCLFSQWEFVSLVRDHYSHCVMISGTAVAMQSRTECNWGPLWLFVPFQCPTITSRE